MAVETTNGGGSAVAIVALVILAALAVLFVMYGLPALQNNGQPNSIEVNLPTGGGEAGGGTTTQ
jgi:hypothetical protein